MTDSTTDADPFEGVEVNDDPRMEHLPAVKSVDASVELTEESKAAEAVRLVKMLTERNELDLKRKAAAKGFGDTIKGLDKRIEDCVHVLRVGKQQRQISVDITYDFENKEVVEYRRDTGDVWHKRPMHPDELQHRLALVEGSDVVHSDGDD